jgi:hypothetical protein
MRKGDTRFWSGFACWDERRPLYAILIALLLITDSGSPDSFHFVSYMIPLIYARLVDNGPSPQVVILPHGSGGSPIQPESIIDGRHNILK